MRFAALPALSALLALPLAAEAEQLTFEIGAGVGAAPAYEGSDEYRATPSFSASVSRLQFLSLNIDRGDGMGFGFGSSIRVLSERDDDDYSRLAGIDDVDAALELGLRLSYRWPQAEVFGALRKGVTGHDGLVMDFGADAILAAGPRTEFRVGPRLSLADEDYAETYFGVPAGASLAAYDADAGLYSYGVEMALRHDFNADWAVEGSLAWTHLTGSAGDSPVVQNRDAGVVSVQLVRTFDWQW
jgi:outer membrane protein